MTQALAKAPAREQSRLAAISGFTDAEIALMEQTVAPKATRLELAFFLVNSARLGLDPILRQIYLIKYSETSPAEIVVGIDGYRARAEQSQVYAGSDDPEFEYDDVGQPENSGPRWPSKATVTVWKIVSGQRVPFTASARWSEFYPGPGKVGEQYRKRPHNQLAIRAESHALRKAFPQQTASLELHVQPPQEWVDAAEADMTRRDDPEATRRNARRYDEIFGPEDQPMAPRRPPAAPAVAQTRVIEGRVVDTVTGEVLIEPDRPGTAHRSVAASSDEDSPSPTDGERAAAIVEQAHAAAQARDETVAQLSRAQLRERWGLLTGKARDLGVEYEPLSQSVSDVDALAAVEDLERRVRDAEAGIVKEGVS
jgi:phage recombination protein Bet